MDFSFLIPPDASIVNYTPSAPAKTIGDILKPFGEDLPQGSVVIIGVPEDRGAVSNTGCAQAPDHIRNKLYQLVKGTYNFEIFDWGNIRPGFSAKDTFFALSSVAAEILRHKCVPVILGGSQDLTFAQYSAYEVLNEVVNIVAVDSRFDLGQAGEEITSQTYLGKIVLHQPNFLFNFSNIGYQTYFVGEEAVQMMDSLYFDVYRLGHVRSDIEEVEPIVRNADMLSFDVSAIRQADAPANGNPSPSGFYGEEACRITRYAGLSDKLTSVGFYEVNPLFERDGQTAHLVSQMLWYLFDGFAGRKKDSPVSGGKMGFIRYRVAVKNTEHEIIFYKSKKSDRWWMEVPYPADKIKLEKHHIIPCSYKDYLMACKEDMPERWWKAFQKLSG